jgi:hypothetical protein
LLLDRYRKRGYCTGIELSRNEEDVMELPTAYLRGVHATNREVLSARPDAPVVPDPPPGQVRVTLARTLYRVSAAIAPAGRRPEALFQ